MDIETQPAEEVLQESPAEKPAAPVFYKLHNISRKKQHRTFRAQQAVHTHKKHFILDNSSRLVAARPQLVSEEVLLRHIDEIRAKAAQYILEVRTPDGRLVDLQTMKALPASPESPLPHPQLDSVANDTPTGIYIPPYVGDDGAQPAIMSSTGKPALLNTPLGEEETSEEPASPAAHAEEPAIVDTDAELEAALAAAQGDESTEPGEQTAQEDTTRKGRRKSR